MTGPPPDIGIRTADPGEVCALPQKVHTVDRRAAYFPDGREGTSRWGRDRAQLIACGHGWGDWVCPAYLDESCPGERNRGTRDEPLRVQVCNLDCGGCGGGGRARTHAYCGHGDRGDPMWHAAIAELGGTLRLDRWTSRPPDHRAEPWPAAYCPVVEAYASNWIDQLQRVPMLATTMQTGQPPKREKSRTIRERLGGYNGRLVLTGFVKDDLLDDMWDNRQRVIEFAKRSEVDVMVCHQYCVPLDTEILTRDGFKRHDEVRVGDETIGYNPRAGRSEWTPITAVHHYDSSPVWRIGNSRWQTRCTPAHRWLTQPYHERQREHGPVRFTQADEFARRDRLLLAAPAAGGHSPLTPQEAAIIAWSLTDGCVRRGPVETRGPRARRALSVTITQSKPQGLIALRDLLADVPHGEYAPRTAAGRIDFHLSADFAHALWEKAGLTDDADLCTFVASLSIPARAAFLHAAWLAEGNMSAAPLLILSQKPGAVADALALAAYLEGYRPSIRVANANGVHSITCARPYIGVRTEHFSAEVLDEEPVWCVTTTLGSMTIRQDGQISLTGQSHYNDDQSCMALYNANRAFYQYELFREAGFPLVAIDVPPSYARPWFADEFFNFCARSQVAAVSVSMQTFGAQGGLNAFHVQGLRHAHEALADDVAILIFGLGTVPAQAMALRCLPGRQVVFCGKEPYAQSIFFQLMPHGTNAPPKMDRAAVFAHNLKWARTTAEKIKAKANRPR